MSLDPKITSFLESAIELMIKDTPKIVQDLRMPELKPILLLSNESDFILGYIIGGIIQSVLVGLNVAGWQLTKEQSDMIIELAFTRTGEIKEAIFKCG